jgi:flagellar hook assembly protein FlgD
VPVDARVDIKVYTVSGELVRELDPFDALEGKNRQFWDGKNSAGNAVASGVFIYRVAAASQRGEHVHDFGKVAALK